MTTKMVYIDAHSTPRGVGVRLNDDQIQAYTQCCHALLTRDGTHRDDVWFCEKCRKNYPGEHDGSVWSLGYTFRGDHILLRQLVAAWTGYSEDVIEVTIDAD